MEENWEKQRSKIIGLGENSFKKSYYPDLQAKISELEEVNKNMETIFDSTSDSIVIHDVKGRIISMNRQAQTLLNINDPAKANFTIFDISSVTKNHSELYDVWEEVIKGTPKTIEWTISQLQTKKEICVQVSINSTTWFGKQVLVSVIRDFTERVLYEQQLYQAKIKAEESDRLKTLFLNNMSHEIRTPMNGIMGFSDLLTVPELSEEKQLQYIKIIQNSSKQLLHIIDDILEISTLETKQVKTLQSEVCLNDVLMELFSIFNLKARENNVSFYLNLALSDEQSIIYSDKSKLQKILGNIVENALKYTHVGYVEISNILEGKNLVICIKDTGTGIAPENQKVIFERFSQEKDTVKNFGGLGLGLSIAKENAELLGGSITLESEKDKGTTFYLNLPYNPVNIQDKSTITELNDQQAKTIMIAEDEEINFLYLEHILKNITTEKYVIIHAKNGLEAVELCDSNKKIDLVLMDIKMPLMDGFEATKKIKAMNPNLPIIAQTAYSTTLDRNKALAFGCDDYISKPINKNDLIEKVMKLIMKNQNK